jgi:hypothetical protein
MSSKLLRATFFIRLADDGSFEVFALNAKSADELQIHTSRQMYVAVPAQDTALGTGLRFVPKDPPNGTPPKPPHP